MKTKIKLLLWSFLTILFVFSTASAVEFYGSKNTEQMVSSYNWYTLQFAPTSSNYLWCIGERYKENGNVKSIKFCEDAVYDIYSTSSYSSALRNGPYTLYSEGNFNLWQKADSNDVFYLKYFNIDGKAKYFKFGIKNIWAKSVKLNSKRGSAVYSSAFIDWLWFALTRKHWDQVRVSQVVNNVFALDWFLIVAKFNESYLVDTYTNKMYRYIDPLYPNSRYIKGETESIFPKIWDNVPSEVSDIQRWPLGDYKMFYNQGELKSFDLKNTREATEADLNEIRENIKKSLVVFNQDALKLYRDIEWLDLSVWDSSDLPNNTQNNTKNNSVEEKKSCVAYYTYMRSMSSHSDWCLWEVNKDMSDTRLDYWWAISTDWDLSKFGVWDKTKYRRCWHWNNYKEGVKKTLWEKWPAFWKDWQTNYIATEAKDIDVNALCSHIVVWSQMNSWGLTFDNFSKAIEWTLLSRGDTVWTLNWVSVPKNVFERDYALMMRYEIACKDKVKLPTEYDTFSDYLLFKSFWGDNNKNVCKKAEELKEKFKEKYKDLIFTKNYEKAFKSDFWEDSVSSSWTVVIEKALSWSIDKAFKFKSPFAFWEKTAWALVDYFTKDYTDWYNKGFSLLGWKGCGDWIWVKEWDYIMRFFLFIILIWLVWKS